MEKIQQAEEIKKVIENQEKAKRKICWAQVGLFVLWALSIAFAIKRLWFSGENTPVDLIMIIFVISMITMVIFPSVRLLNNCITEKEQEAKRWRTKLLDSYGSVLEAEVKMIKKEYEEMAKSLVNNTNETTNPKNETQNNK